MASNKMNWILSMLALVSCVLISTVASDQTLSEELISKLKNDSLTPVETEELLLSYKSEKIKIYDRSVADWTGLCDLSIEKCYVNEHHRIMRLMRSYAVRDIPNLRKYGNYCVEEKIKNYCAANVDKVARLLLEGASDEDKKLMRSFLRIVTGKTNLGEASHEDIRTAYYELRNASIGSHANSGSEKKFKFELIRAFKCFSKIHYFLPFLSYFRDEDKRIATPTSDILLSEWYNLGKISFKYVDFVAKL